jgi:hypothetical protein
MEPGPGRTVDRARDGRTRPMRRGDGSRAATTGRSPGGTGAARPAYGPPGASRRRGQARLRGAPDTAPRTRPGRRCPPGTARARRGRGARPAGGCGRSPWPAAVLRAAPPLSAGLARSPLPLYPLASRHGPGPCPGRADSAVVAQAGPWTVRSCVTASCSRCGTAPLDEDTRLTPHFTGIDQARRELPRDWGWTCVPRSNWPKDDELLCPACARATHRPFQPHARRKLTP